MIRLTALKLHKVVIVQQPNMNIKVFHKGQAMQNCFEQGKNVTTVNNALTKFVKLY